MNRVEALSSSSLGLAADAERHGLILGWYTWQRQERYELLREGMREASAPKTEAGVQLLRVWLNGFIRGRAYGV